MFTHSIIKKTNYGFQKHVVIAYATYHTAPQWQKGITDNFVKIELSPLLGPEWQYLSLGIIKHPILDL